METQILRLKKTLNDKLFSNESVHDNLLQISKIIHSWRKQIHYDILKLKKIEEMNDTVENKIQLDDLTEEYAKLSKLQLNILEILTFKSSRQFNK